MSSIGVAQLTLAWIVFMVASYITNIFLGRTLGPELYGAYGVITALMTAMNIMQVAGVPQAVSKFVAEDEKQGDAILKGALNIQAVLTLLAAFIFFLLAPVVANIFNDTRFLGWTQLTALVFPVYGLFALYGGYYNGLSNFRRQAIMNAAYSVAKVVLVIGLSIAFSLNGVIVAFILAPLLALLVGFKVPKASTGFPSKRLLLYAAPLIGFSALSALQLSIDLFSLKALTDNAKLSGYYVAAQNIALIPYLAMSAIGQVLFPTISRYISGGNLDKASATVQQSLRFLLVLLIPGTVLLIVTSRQIVQVLYGLQYAPAAQVLQVLLVGYSFIAIFAVLANALNGSGRAKSSMMLAGVGVLVTLFASVVLIPGLELTGAALGTCIGSSLAATGGYILVRKNFGIRFPWTSLMRISLAASVVYILGILLHYPLMLLPLVYLFLLVIYLAILWLSGEVTADDRLRFKALLPSWMPLRRYL